MTSKQWKIFALLHFIIALLIFSPFLPGPSALAHIVNRFLDLAQLSNALLLPLIPVGIIGMTLYFLNKGKGIYRRSLFASLLLTTVPITIFFCSLFPPETIRTFSRNYAIHRANDLTEAIDRYKSEQGELPKSLEQLCPQYIPKIPSPGIMGISSYRYHNYDTSCELSFCQNGLLGFNVEIVSYSSSNNHKQKGELPTLYATGIPQWKYYIYD